MNLFYMGVLGMLGVYARYFTGVLVNRYVPPPFPFATFAINVVGSFLIGVVFVIGSEKQIISENLRLGLMVGFLGGFTTFSSYSLETARLIQEERYVTALTYLGISPILGLLCALLGIFLARSFTGGQVL